MPYDPEKHHRRSIRLKGYDYTQPGAYFITLVTYQRECLFGVLLAGETRLNRIGKIIERCWRGISTHFPTVLLDGFIVMPNHLHGLIILQDRTGEASAGKKLAAHVLATRPINSPNQSCAGRCFAPIPKRYAAWLPRRHNPEF